MAYFSVVWRVEVEAADPVLAALEADRLRFDPLANDRHYVVDGCTGKPMLIELPDDLMLKAA